MKKSELTEKWQKCLIPARMRLANINHPWLMENEVEIVIKGESPDMSFTAKSAHTHFIPVTEWPKKGKGK